MTFKAMATAAAMITAASAGGGCTAIPPDIYNAFGRLSPVQPSSAPASPASVTSTDASLNATDPDPRVRFEIMRQGRRAN
jgi:hypothetical protein